MLLFSAAVFYLCHLICESTSSFVKYNYASLGRHMQGINVANFFAIISRGFVALYGLTAAYIIEKNDTDSIIYGVTFGVTLLFGAFISYLYSRVNLKFVPTVKPYRTLLLRVFSADIYDHSRYFIESIRIDKLLSVMVGVQFAAVVIAYWFCIIFPNDRLLIISLVPVISMFGTIVTVVFVEPELASVIDESSDAAYAVSQEFMRARSVSFVFASIVLFGLAVISKCCVT